MPPGGPKTAVHWAAKWTPFPCRHWWHHPSLTQGWRATWKCSGPEPHTSEVAAQVERAQRPDANALWHWVEGLAGERALGPIAPSLVVWPPSALVFAVLRNLAPHEAVKDPVKGHMCTTTNDNPPAASRGRGVKRRLP